MKVFNCLVCRGVSTSVAPPTISEIGHVLCSQFTHKNTGIYCNFSLSFSLLQESEIAEVLYKQDVDLGFSLDQEQIINASYASGNSGAKNRDKSDADKAGPDAEEKDQKKAKANDGTDKKADNNDDDDNIEKLKALEELRQDKVQHDG